MKRAIASLSLLMVLGACSAPQAPAQQEAPAAAADPAVPGPGPGAMGKRAPGQDDAAPLQVFRAFGTEPFWDVNVEDATLTFTTPDDQAGEVMQGLRRTLPDGVAIEGSHSGQAFALAVIAGECSDGMSDNRYILVATFRLGDVEYRGCGEAAR
jgi:uncharacterized membrane protein